MALLKEKKKGKMPPTRKRRTHAERSCMRERESKEKKKRGLCPFMRKERASQLREANECSLKHRITSMLEAGAFFYLYAIEQAATHFLVQLLFTLEVLLLSKTKNINRRRGKKKQQWQRQ